MTDRPILFSGPMVRALLEGRKTQTRRLAYRDTTTNRAGETYGLNATPWKRVQPGDRLWVRETWGTHAGPGIYCCEDDRPNAPRKGGGFSPVTFRADADGRSWGMYGPPTWRPSIHMPRCASRLTLTVTAVRVERLQAISDEDAAAEGVAPRAPGEPPGMAAYRFRELWDDLHGPDSWDANPEVVVLTFTVRQGNIDHE